MEAVFNDPLVNCSCLFFLVNFSHIFNAFFEGSKQQHEKKIVNFEIISWDHFRLKVFLLIARDSIVI